MFNRFGIGFGTVLGYQMEPWESWIVEHPAPWGVRDGLGIVLVRFFFRLVVCFRFFVPLGLLLGSSWGAFGSVLGRLGLSWARFGSSWALLGSFLGTPDGMLESYNPKFPSTHQLVNR